MSLSLLPALPLSLLSHLSRKASVTKELLQILLAGYKAAYTFPRVPIAPPPEKRSLLLEVRN